MTLSAKNKVRAISLTQQQAFRLARSRHKTKSRESAKAANVEQAEFGPLQAWIGFNLRMAQTASFQAFSRLSKEIGMRPGRFATLTLIALNPGISQTALSRANGRDKSTLTPLLADLVRRGFVRRIRARADRRSYGLTLTAAGHDLVRKLTTCAQQHERNLNRIVGARNRSLLLRTLRRIASELSQ
jgi:DNA-binding MarR family transcriptional regulator